MTRDQQTRSGERLPRKILDELKAARQSATMEDASFDWPDSTMTASCRSGNFNGRPDAFIKERTRLYRQSWIISRLDTIIAWAEGEPAKR